MKFANIVYKDDLVNHKKVEYINYIQEDIPFKQIDNELPTLYVGWYNLKEIHKDDTVANIFNILEKRIVTNRLYWEFSFKENKSQHVNGVEDFIIDCLDYYFLPRYSYINLDPIHFAIKDIEELFDILPKEIDAVYNYKGEMMFLLKDDKITGIDLKLYSYFDFDLVKLNDKIVSRLETPIINYNNDPIGESYLKKYKILPDFEKLKRYMVVLLSK